MVYKSRTISIDSYFMILQREYICTHLRWQVYPHANDKRHFENVMLKKKGKIQSISEKEGFPDLFMDKYMYAKLYMEVVPEYGLPQFIYNERVQPDEVKKQYKFPYSGTLVFSADEGKIGLTDYVDFDNKVVFIRFDKKKESQPYNYKGVKRLSLEQSDRYYYYSDGKFYRKGMEGIYDGGVGYNFDTDEISLINNYNNPEGAPLDVMIIKTEDVRRIL